jgi:hypothetical protein
MALVRAISNPVMAYRKAREYGLGRLVIHFSKDLPGPIADFFRSSIKVGKIAADPLGFIKRKRLAADLVKQSSYRDYFPEETAFVIAPPGTFKAVDDIVPVARCIVADFMSAHPSGRANKSSYSYLLCDYRNSPADGNVTDLARFPQFQDLALSRPFVEMASKYIGEVPVVSSVLLQVVMPNETVEGFQQFHIDRIDNRQFKIFIAIEDVDEDNGATMVLPADASEALARSINYEYGRIPDDVVYSDKWKPHMKLAAGPAGSAFIFDTCRLVHAGARARNKPRVIIQLQYVSKYSQAEGPAQLNKVIFDKSRARDEVDRLVLAA